MSSDVLTDKLVEAVVEMRSHQRAYFGGDRSAARLEASRTAEREVDRLLAEIKSGQGSLFG